MGSQVLTHELSPPGEVLLFGSFSEEEASFFQATPLKLYNAVPRGEDPLGHKTPSASSLEPSSVTSAPQLRPCPSAAEAEQPSSLRTQSAFETRDLAQQQPVPDAVPASSSSDDETSDKVITVVRSSGAPEPAEHVGPSGQGDSTLLPLTHEGVQPGNHRQSGAPGLGADQDGDLCPSPPVVDKLPLPPPGQPQPAVGDTALQDAQLAAPGHPGVPAGTGAVAGIAPGITCGVPPGVPAGAGAPVPAAAAQAQVPSAPPPLQRGEGPAVPGIRPQLPEQATASPLPAPAPVKKVPPSSWAALVASQGSSGAPPLAPRQAPAQSSSPAPMPLASAATLTGAGSPLPTAPAVASPPATVAGPASQPAGMPLQSAAAPLAPEPRGQAPTGPFQSGTATGPYQPGTASSGGGLGRSRPRGLVNAGNLCFANSTLQALVGSGAFVELLDGLHGDRDTSRAACPTVRSFLSFWKTLHQSADGQTAAKIPPAATAPTPSPATPGDQVNRTAPPGDAPRAEVSSNSLAQGVSAVPLLAQAEATGSEACRGAPPGTSSAAVQGAPPLPGPAQSYAALAKAGRPYGHGAPPLDPTPIFQSVLTSFSPQHYRHGVQIRQEDAQEFLSYLLDRMHDELCATSKKPGSASSAEQSHGVEDVSVNGALMDGNHHPSAGDDSEDGWETVGPKNRTAVTRKHKHDLSEVSSIFFGQLRSEIKTRGAKASTTLQPFSVLQLDISREAVRSVDDALVAFGQAELVEGYRPEEGPSSHPTTASKVVKIQALPRVLVLHLMRFTYGARGSSKVHKPIAFPLVLNIPKDIVYAPAAASSPLATPEGRRYRLFATVVHHGKEPSRGHYTADVRQPDDSWLRFDDANVAPIPVNRVVREQAYLLLYEKV